MIDTVLVGILCAVGMVLLVLWGERRLPSKFLPELSRLPSDRERHEVLRLLRGESERIDRARKVVLLTLVPITAGVTGAVLFFACTRYPVNSRPWPIIPIIGFTGGAVNWAMRGRLRRRLRGLLSDRGVPICVGCGYDLTGNDSGMCPECGEEVQERGTGSGRRE